MSSLLVIRTNGSLEGLLLYCYFFFFKDISGIEPATCCAGTMTHPLSTPARASVALCHKTGSGLSGAQCRRSCSGSHVCQMLRGPTAECAGGGLSNGEQCRPRRAGEAGQRTEGGHIFARSLVIEITVQNGFIPRKCRQSLKTLQLLFPRVSPGRRRAGGGPGSGGSSAREAGPARPSSCPFPPKGTPVAAGLRAGMPGLTAGEPEAGTTEPPPSQVLLLGAQLEDRV